MKAGGEAIMEGESGRDRRHGRFERFMHTIKNSHQLTFQGLQSLFRRGGTMDIFCIQTSYALLQDRFWSAKKTLQTLLCIFLFGRVVE